MTKTKASLMVEPEPCGYCHRLEDDGGRRPEFVVYLEPGGRERGSHHRWPAHAECIADTAAEGGLRRVSSFAFEVVAHELPSDDISPVLNVAGRTA